MTGRNSTRIKLEGNSTRRNSRYFVTGSKSVKTKLRSIISRCNFFKTKLDRIVRRRNSTIKTGRTVSRRNSFGIEIRSIVVWYSFVTTKTEPNSIVGCVHSK